MTVHRSNRDHYDNEPHTNNSNYAEFVSSVVQSRRDTNNPSPSKCEHSGNQANINSQMRLAKSMSHAPTEAELQQPPKRQKTYGQNNRPLSITPRPSTSQAQNYIDLATEGPSPNQPPDCRQPASTSEPTTPLSGHCSELRRPTPTTNYVLSHSDFPLRRTWSLVQSTWVPNALSHDNNDHPPDPDLPMTVFLGTRG